VLKRLLLTSDTVGGVWRYSLELAHGFAALGVDVTLATLGPPPTETQRLEAAHVPGLRLFCTNLPLEWLAQGPAQLALAGRELARMAKYMRADAVHLHSPALASDASWPAPVVAVAHSCVGTWWRAVRGGELPADLAWRAHAIERGMAAADAVIAPSRSFAAALRRHYHRARAIHVVYNGRRPATAGVERNRHVFTAGRLWDAGKNVAAIDAAASRLSVPVLAAGPAVGPHGEAMAPRHLRLLGNLDAPAMAEQFSAAAVFVSVARYEPFGLAVLEAAQAGCALVLSDIPTFRELWDCAALFVDPHDPDCLAELLHALLRLPARCAYLGELARQRASSLSLERMIEATWRVHQSLQVPVHMAAA
jgi:glycosyltransferase involved in cell wall biosynthesis